MSSQENCSERKIITRMNDFLRQMLECQTPDIFEVGKPTLPDIQEKLALIEEDIVDIEEQIRVLIRKQLTAR